MPLFLDGALHCQIPKHLSVYSLFYIHKNVYMTDISSEAADQERNESNSDMWKQERGHTMNTSDDHLVLRPDNFIFLMHFNLRVLL